SCQYHLFQIEITTVRGAGLRCYKLLDNPPNSPESPITPSAGELRDRLVDILVDEDPNPVHLNSFGKLYKKKYGSELNLEAQAIKKIVLESFAGTFQLDMNGVCLSLNPEDYNVRKKLDAKHLQASLDANLDSDSFESSKSSLSESSKTYRDLSAVNPDLGREPGTGTSVYIGLDSLPNRNVRNILEKPDRTFDRDSRLSRSFHGRAKVTTYHDDEKLSDLAGGDLLKEMVVSSYLSVLAL
ncbi:unnamed protein product, partial [Strongylus vulgaris]